MWSDFTDLIIFGNDNTAVSVLPHLAKTLLVLNLFVLQPIVSKRKIGSIVTLPHEDE